MDTENYYIWWYASYAVKFSQCEMEEARVSAEFYCLLIFVIHWNKNIKLW